MGLEDGKVLLKLMEHACVSTGLALRPASYPAKPEPGEFIHLASHDALAPAGVSKVLARDPEDVRKLYVALHGQAIQVGADMIGVEVKNDFITLQTGSGDDPRGRA